VKTRTGAARLIHDGKVRINGKRALNPSRLIRAGDVITATNSGRLSVVRVIKAVERRGPVSLARELYKDLTPEQPAPEELAASSRAGARPTKRDRRRLDALRCVDE
jgi:ribosome-associated heat shock protein Hsp15